MNFVEPLQALVPGAVGRVVAVLMQTSMPLSGRAIARLADVSPAQAARVLSRLAELGVVESRSAPPAVLYSLVPDHVAVAPLRALSELHASFVERLRVAVEVAEPRPLLVAIFGSFARREAGVDSDIDLLVVRPSDVEDDAWFASIEGIRWTASRASGNRVEMLDVDQAEVHKLLRSGKPLWREIQREAQVVSGPSLDDL